MPENFFEDPYGTDEDLYTDHEDNYNIVLTSEGHSAFAFLRDYLCVEQLGIVKYWDTNDN